MSESSNSALSEADLRRLRKLAADPRWYPGHGREMDWEHAYRVTVARLLEHIDALSACARA